jgi:hypothetical protein
LDIFTLPNVQDSPTYPFAARPSSLDWLTVAMARWNGVISGCEVTEMGSPGMGVDVASGRVLLNGVGVDITGDTVLLSVADGTHPRWDLIVAESGGTPDVRTGTAAENPVPPVPAALSLGTEVALAIVYVPANDTAVLDSQVFSKSVPVPEPLGATGWTTITASDQTTGGTISNDASLNTDTQLLFAMAANTKYRIRALLLIQGGATTSGVRVGITGPASPTRIALAGQWQSNLADTSAPVSFTMRNYTAYDATGVATGGTAARVFYFGLEGVVHNGANTGNFALGWAQQTAIAENTIRLDGSYLEYEAV